MEGLAIAFPIYQHPRDVSKHVAIKLSEAWADSYVYLSLTGRKVPLALINPPSPSPPIPRLPTHKSFELWKRRIHEELQ